MAYDFFSRRFHEVENTAAGIRENYPQMIEEKNSRRCYERKITADDRREKYPQILWIKSNRKFYLSISL